MNNQSIIFERLKSFHFYCQKSMSLKSKRSKKLNCPEEKSISYLIDSFTNGFFIEVNCHFLPEENLDQLAYQVYQFIEKQGLNENIFSSKHFS